MGSNQSSTQSCLNAVPSNTLLKRNSSSFRNLYSGKKEHIYKKWKFHNEQQAFNKFLTLQKKVGACPYVLNASDVKYVKGQKGQFYINTLIQYPQHTLKQQILSRQKQYRTFDQSDLWKCLSEVAKGLLYLRKNGSDYFPQSLSQIYYSVDGVFKIKDPSLLPVIKESPQFQAAKKSDCQMLAEIIVSMGILSENQKILFSDFNRMSLRYSLQLATLLHKMYEGQTNIHQIIHEFKNDRNLIHLIRMFPSQTENAKISPENIDKVTAKTSTDSISELIIRHKKQSIQSTLPNQHSPHKIIVRDHEKENNHKTANIKYSDEPEITFPKNLKALRKTQSVSENLSPQISIVKEERKSQIQQKNQQFIQLTGGSTYNLFHQKSQESLLESIIQDQESILLRESGSPVAALVDELDAIASDFLKISDGFLECQKSRSIERGAHINSTIMEVPQQNESSQIDISQQIREISHSTIFSEYASNPTYVIEEYEGGSRYQGHLLNGARNGFGKLFYEDGGSYQGQWKNGAIHGYGQLFYQSNKLAYEGYWRNGEFDGKGKIINEKPQPLSDYFNFKDFSDLEGYWISYEGEFKNDNKNGKGILTLSNGQKLDAIWVDNNIEGKGKFFTMNGQQIDGVWSCNILQELH